MKLRVTGVHLNINRRAALKAAIGLGAAMVFQPKNLFAQAQPLMSPSGMVEIPRSFDGTQDMI
jgi:hypothetical protein